MYTSVLVVFSFVISAQCATTRYKWNSPDLKISKIIPVSPIKVQCSLADIIILSAPIIASKRPKYQLYNPQGDYRILKIHPPRFKYKRSQKSAIEVLSFNKTKVIVPKNKASIFNVNKKYKIEENEDAFYEKQKETDTYEVFGKNQKQRELNNVFNEKQKKWEFKHDMDETEQKELKYVFDEKQKKRELQEVFSEKQKNSESNAVFGEKQKRETGDVFGGTQKKSESNDVFGEKQKKRELKDVFGEKQKKMDLNEFMIGPVGVEDYGNWILSMLYQQDGEWVEFYQVISIDILEYIPPLWSHPVLAEGDSFNLSFAYPMKDIKSCQLIVPSSTFDRFYDRQDVNIDTCGYIVTNITAEDAGLWEIIAVGRITYVTAVNLTVISFSQLTG